MYVDPSGKFSLAEVMATVRTIGTLARLAVPRIAGGAARVFTTIGRAMIQGFTRAIGWAWRSGRSGLNYLRSQFRSLRTRIQQFSRSREKLIYLHYSFLKFSGSFAARGLVGAPAFATWSLYATGWAAKKGLALRCVQKR